MNTLMMTQYCRAKAFIATRGLISLFMAILVILLLGACEGPAPIPGTSNVNKKKADSAPWFEEGAKLAGIDFVHSTGFDNKHFYFPEIYCGGVALLDFDNDGLLDVYFVQSGHLDKEKSVHGNRLYRNLGNRKFEDVTASSGTGDKSYGIGCSCGDYNNDGYVDIYVVNTGPDVLYRNNGDGSFTDVSEEAGIARQGRAGSSSTFGDYDGDGDLDLFVVHYVDWSKAVELQCYNVQGAPDYCQPLNYKLPGKDVLYRNNGNGTFTDVSKELGLHAAFGNGLGVAAGDLNDDGRLDFFVANDSDPNQLWVQNSQGRFEESSLWSGVAVNQMGDSEAGMGASATDVDQDGDLDIFISHLMQETNTFYLNTGGGIFEDRTDEYGFGSTSYQYTGWGLGFADFNNDSRLDLYVANGGVMIPDSFEGVDPYVQHNLLLTQDENSKFVAVSPKGGTSPALLASSRGAAFGDIDNDGAIDIVVANRESSPYLLWNKSGVAKNWIRFSVRDGARAAHYARLSIKGSFGQRHGMVDCGYSYASSSDSRVHFGLGNATAVDEVSVKWTDGTVENFGALPIGKTHDLIRGEGKTP